MFPKHNINKVPTKTNTNNNETTNTIGKTKQGEFSDCKEYTIAYINYEKVVNYLSLFVTLVHIIHVNGSKSHYTIIAHRGKIFISSTTTIISLRKK